MASEKPNFQVMEGVIVNYHAQPGKNSPVYKIHNPDIPVRLLTAGCNTTIENLYRFTDSIWAPLTSNLPNAIKGTSHSLDFIDDINKSSLPDKLILVSFDIITMFPNIENERGIEAVRSVLDSRSLKNSSTECIMEGTDICLLHNNLRFANINYCKQLVLPLEHQTHVFIPI